MRKIEKRIIDTVNSGPYPKQLSIRDRVEYDKISGRVLVYLHSTMIASIASLAQDKPTVIINTGGWRTNTTKSRLNAILREYCNTGIYQRDYTWYLQGSRDALFTGRKNPEVIDGMAIPRIR